MWSLPFLILFIPDQSLSIRDISIRWIIICPKTISWQKYYWSDRLMDRMPILYKWNIIIYVHMYAFISESNAQIFLLRRKVYFTEPVTPSPIQIHQINSLKKRLIKLSNRRNYKDLNGNLDGWMDLDRMDLRDSCHFKMNVTGVDRMYKGIMAWRGQFISKHHPLFETFKMMWL